MSDQHHKSRQSDDEEEDLELLRLAALKSLHTKKDAPPVSYHPAPVPSRTNQVVGSPYSGTQKTVASYTKGNALRTEQGSYYPSDHNLNFQRPVSNTIEPCDTRSMLEKLDISEPYIPQQILPVNNVNPISTGAAWPAESANNGYVPPYIPHKTSETTLGVSGVQLSPRSLAFVAENNDILMRRKGENSSPNYHRSQFDSGFRPISPGYEPMSPIYVPKSPTYRSPPPASRNRPNHYAHRRSISRSPPPSRGRSPILRRRTSSRTPPPQSNRNVSPYPYYSPRSPRPSSLAKRVKSRSPIANTRYKSPLRRSRSPPLHSRHGRPNSKSPNINGKRRSPMPVGRHTHKGRLSPVQQKRSPPVHDSIIPRHTNRLRSPTNVMPNNVVRSRSRSPPRKMPRRSRDRNIPSSQPLRRRSPYTNDRRRHDGPANGYRNRMRKRSTSPAHGGHIRKRSRTKSPGRMRREENRNRRNDRNVRREPGKNEKQREEERNVDNKQRELPNKSPKTTETPDLKVEPAPAKKEEVVEKKPEITIDNKENTVEQKEVEQTVVEEQQIPKEESEREEEEEESSDDDDGIDLFPSDESESENEGRFKLHCKNERDTNVSTPSFTKLGESSIPEVVKELKDVEAPKDQSSNRNNSRRLDDRDRGRDQYDSRRREDRFRKLDSGRNSRNDRKRVNGSNSGGRREREREPSNKFDEKKRDEKPMFKSTFQAVESEFPKSSERLNEDKNISDKKSSAHLKRRLHTKDDKDSPDKEVSNDKLSSVVNASSGNSGGSGSSTSGSGNNGNGGKKPIHLRLGAMTNTFKAPKKSSTWNSLDKV